MEGAREGGGWRGRKYGREEKGRDSKFRFRQRPGKALLLLGPDGTSAQRALGAGGILGFWVANGCRGKPALWVKGVFGWKGRKVTGRVMVGMVSFHMRDFISD